MAFMFIHHYNLKHELLTVLHEVIDDIGEKRISVDKGYDQIIQLVFGFENYLPLDHRSKLIWLASIAEITYSVTHIDFCWEEDIEYYYDLFLERCYTGDW